MRSVSLVVCPLLHLLLLLLLVGSAEAKGGKKWSKLSKELESIEQRVAAMEKGSCQRTTCPVGFSPYKRSCFHFVMSETGRRNWFQAKEHCRSIGANLVTIQNPGQLKFVEKYLESNFNKPTYNNGKTEIFTGLIGTDSQAELPFNPVRYITNKKFYTSEMVGFRWTATQEAVELGDELSPPGPPVAHFSPVIEGTKTAPDIGYLSCVVLVWEPGKPRDDRLRFVFGDCEAKSQYVCEVRPPRRKCRLRDRYRRSVVLYGRTMEVESEDHELAKQADNKVADDGDHDSGIEDDGDNYFDDEEFGAYYHGGDFEGDDWDEEETEDEIHGDWRKGGGGRPVGVVESDMRHAPNAEEAVEQFARGGSEGREEVDHELEYSDYGVSVYEDDYF